MTRVRPGNNGYTHRIRVSHRVKGLFRRTQCAFAIRSHQSDSRPAIENVVDVEGAFMRHREIELGTADLPSPQPTGDDRRSPRQRPRPRCRIAPPMTRVP